MCLVGPLGSTQLASQEHARTCPQPGSDPAVRARRPRDQHRSRGASAGALPRRPAPGAAAPSSAQMPAASDPAGTPEMQTAENHTCCISSQCYKLVIWTPQFTVAISQMPCDPEPLPGMMLMLKTRKHLPSPVMGEERNILVSERELSGIGMERTGTRSRVRC